MIYIYIDRILLYFTMVLLICGFLDLWFYWFVVLVGGVGCMLLKLAEWKSGGWLVGSMEVWTGGMKTGGWLVGSMEVWTGGMKTGGWLVGSMTGGMRYDWFSVLL